MPKPYTANRSNPLRRWRRSRLPLTLKAMRVISDRLDNDFFHLRLRTDRRYLHRVHRTIERLEQRARRHGYKTRLKGT